MSDPSAPPMTRVRNVTGHEPCAACIDGWVELVGTVTIGGHTYSRGMAPCRWCELGLKRWEHHRGLADDFDGAEIIPPENPGRHFKPNAAFLRERLAAGDRREALMAMFPRRIWPEEWPRTAPTPPVQAMPPAGDDPAEVARKRRIAEIAAAQVEAELQEPVSAARSDTRDLQHVPAEDSPI